MHRFHRHLLIASVSIAAAGIGAYLFFGGKQDPQVSSPPQSPTYNSHSLPLHPVVTRIVNEGPDLPYLKFNYLIKELPLNLPSHDIDALVVFISGPRPPQFQEAEWGSLVNDIEENLTVQTVPSGKVAQALIAIFRDESKIQMQRDYALQHVGGFAIYLVHTGALTSAGSPLPSTIQKQQSAIFNPLLSELKTAAAQSSKPWSGTALNLLDGLLRAAEYRSVEVAGLNSDSLVEMAIPIARNPSAPLNARLPALQAASRNDSLEARDIAREILSSPDSGLMLVQCASACLARLGTTEDLPLLQTASSNANRHTTPAITEAIRSIQTRSQTN